MGARGTETDPKKRVEEMLRAVDQEDAALLPQLVTSMLEQFTDAHPFVRRAALDALGRIAEFRGVAIELETASKIARMAGDPDPGVRSETAIALAMISKGGGQSETERLALHRLLEDPDASVRREAAAALGDVRDETAKEGLASRAAGDGDGDVRFEAAFALAAMQDRRALGELISALDKPRRRLDACEGLRRLNDPAAIPALEKLATRFFLAWPDRLTALATMHALGDAAAGIGVLERTRSRNREERAYALALIGSHRIAAGLQVLIELASNPKDALRDTAVRALGELGDRAGTEVLERVAADPSAAAEIRADAQAALEKVKAKMVGSSP
jgi:HEAT repeat protein